MTDFFLKFFSIFKKIKSEYLTPILLIVLLCLLAYGLLIPWLGFYWDDWGFAWTINFLGPKEFISSFLPFRPFLGPIFSLTTSIVGVSPLSWQLFGLLVRICTGLAAFWSLRQIWPKAHLQTLLASLYFVVFPGYNQQWVALTHSNQELISLIFYLLSIGFMVKATRSKVINIKLSVIAMLFAFWGLYPTEYFFGLEFLRPFIIWFILREKIFGNRDIIKKTLLAWLPYLLLWISNGVFLILYHNSPYYHSYGLNISLFADSSIKTIILQTIETFIQAIITTGINSWANTISLLTKPLSEITTLVTLVLITISFVISYRVILKMHSNENSIGTSNSFGWQAIMLGLLGIAAGRIPSWLAGFPLEIEFDLDRFMLSTMLGGSLFFIGLVDYFIQIKNRKILVACIFIAFSVGWQFTIANNFRREWDNQRRFFHQLSWRIPALKTRTLIATHELPFNYVTDNSLTAALNWIYAPEIKSHTLPYMLAYTKARLGSSLLPSLSPGVPISLNYRTMNYRSNTDNIVVIFQEYPGCVRVMDPVYSNSDTIPGVTYMLLDAIPLSNLDQIITDAPQPDLPSFLFGIEPQHTWCYFFEKAELARQMGNWKEIIQLGDEAFLNGFSALQPAEYFVFIEAYANNSRIDDAIQLTKKVISEKPELKPALCGLWNRVQLSQFEHMQIEDTLTILDCGEQ